MMEHKLEDGEYVARYMVFRQGDPGHPATQGTMIAFHFPVTLQVATGKEPVIKDMFFGCGSFQRLELHQNWPNQPTLYLHYEWWTVGEEPVNCRLALHGVQKEEEIST